MDPMADHQVGGSASTPELGTAEPGAEDFAEAGPETIQQEEPLPGQGKFLELKESCLVSFGLFNIVLWYRILLLNMSKHLLPSICCHQFDL